MRKLNGINFSFTHTRVYTGIPDTLLNFNKLIIHFGYLLCERFMANFVKLFSFCFFHFNSARSRVRGKKDEIFTSFFVPAPSFRTLQRQALLNDLSSGKRAASVPVQSNNNAFSTSAKCLFPPSGLLSRQNFAWFLPASQTQNRRQNKFLGYVSA